MIASNNDPIIDFSANLDVRLSDKETSHLDGFYFETKIVNTSSVTWPARGPHPVRLSYHWLNEAGEIVVFDGARTLLAEDLCAGGTAHLECKVPYLGIHGSFFLEFDMVQELVAWFKDKGSAIVRIPVTISGKLPTFSEYEQVWGDADLNKDYWSVVGPSSEAEFKQLGALKLKSLIDLGLTPSSHILDVGCGTGCLTHAAMSYLSEKGSYVGTELTDKAVEFCRTRYRSGNFSFLRNSIDRIPMSGRQFDAIVFSSVFTHTYLRETESLLRDAKVLLNESGFVFADLFFGKSLNASPANRAIVLTQEDEFYDILKKLNIDFHVLSESVWKFDTLVARRVQFKLTSQ